MIGLSVILAIAAYVWIAYAIVKRLPNRKVKYAVIAFFVLIPSWDIVPSWLYLQYLCKTEGGTRIFKTVNGVDGFLNSAGLAIVDEALKTHGFKYIEGVNARYIIGPDGSIAKQKIDTPISRYEIKGGQTYQSLPLTLNRLQTVIVDKESGETLATLTLFNSYGGWIRKSFSPLLGYGPRCGDEIRYEDFYLRALKPVKSSN